MFDNLGPHNDQSNLKGNISTTDYLSDRNQVPKLGELTAGEVKMLMLEM